MHPVPVQSLTDTSSAATDAGDAVTEFQAYRFALDPTPRQVRELARHCGAARVAFNWGLGLVKAVTDQRAAEISYGIPPGALTPTLSWTLPALRRAWNRTKDLVAPWWRECSKEAYSTGLAQLSTALRNWTESKSGNRKGRRVGFPRFKAKRRSGMSCRFTTGAIRVEADRHHVTLPRLGRIKTFESTRKLARRLESGTARILSATIRFQTGRWWCAFTCEVQRLMRCPAQAGTVVGLDIGITHLAVLSQPVPGLTDADGMVRNPRHMAAAQRRLRRNSRRVSRRRGPDQSTRQKPSQRWRVANRRRNRVHHRVVNLRRDGLHKLTTGLARSVAVIVIEDLHVAGMLRNRRLARSIADAGFGEIRRQLDYKIRWSGGHLVVADRWYPSSKTCSDCGAVKPKLPLHVRVFRCDVCGHTVDRDVNAARNLAALAAAINSTGAGVAGNLEAQPALNGRGADQKSPPGGAGGCEASTPHRTPGQDGDRPPVTAGCK
ncbi:IS607 family element RNA-guided endonuclease TnpB [Kibdelosporangium aridum]|uniref:IS607 family element RNA-guided endonuclease TnpB n=1 Tax=Kibdelosporangium aridum TaxID=2030 RepID=UPI0035EC0FF1